jgi:psiF repeat
MRRSTWMVAVGAALAVAAAQGVVAQAAHENSQQEKMTTCNTDAKAKGLKGDERKAFMKSCLSEKGASASASAGSAAAAPSATLNSQQEKMKSCNADAKTKGLKGTERKAFMKSCLSGSSATAH